jgi:hypothetical protein
VTIALFSSVFVMGFSREKLCLHVKLALNSGRTSKLRSIYHYAVQ